MQGTFLAMVISLTFSMWLGVGQTIAFYVGAITVPTKNTTIENCPEEWLSSSSSSAVGYKR